MQLSWCTVHVPSISDGLTGAVHVRAYKAVVDESCILDVNLYTNDDRLHEQLWLCLLELIGRRTKKSVTAVARDYSEQSPYCPNASAGCDEHPHMRKQLTLTDWVWQRKLHIGWSSW